MLAKTVFTNKLTCLVAAYPNWRFNYNDEDVVSIWYSYFKTMSNDDFSIMVDEYITSETLPPTIAGLFRHKPVKPVQVPKELQEKLDAIFKGGD